MADTPTPTPPPPTERHSPRWPWILGGLLGGFLLVAAGLGLGWYLFYRPVVNVAVQLPAPPAPPAPPGPDQAQLKALEDQIDKQKTANKQIEDQIAALKDRLRQDVCTAKEPLGKTPPGATPVPEGTLPERKTEAGPPPPTAVAIRQELVDQMKALSAADLSVLKASMPYDDAVLTTLPGSPNAELWGKFETLTWMRQVPSTFPKDLPVKLMQFSVTPHGKQPIASLLAEVSL